MKTGKTEERKKTDPFFHLKKIKNKSHQKTGFKGAFFQGWGMF